MNTRTPMPIQILVLTQHIFYGHIFWLITFLQNGRLHDLLCGNTINKIYIKYNFMSHAK